MSDQSSFIAAVWKERKLSAKHRGPIAFVPIRIIFLILVPLIFFHYYVHHKTDVLNDDSLNKITSSILVVYGFFGAATVATIIQVQEIITKFPFSDFLTERNVFDVYSILPQFVFVVDLLSLLLCAIIIVISTIMNDEINTYFLLFLVSNLIYCAWLNYDLLNTIRGLSFHYSEYERIKFEMENE